MISDIEAVIKLQATVTMVHSGRMNKNTESVSECPADEFPIAVIGENDVAEAAVGPAIMDAADVEGAMANQDYQEGEGCGAEEAAVPSRWHEMSICLMVHPVDGRCAPTLITPHLSTIITTPHIRLWCTQWTSPHAEQSIPRNPNLPSTVSPLMRAFTSTY